MPSLTVTAVDTGADTLTAAGHGLLTGDRFRLRNIGGALPAATPALAAVTDYFAIRVDDDKVKVAESSADAVAGTAVDLTGAGTGTHKIEHGLPYCVPRIAAPGVQIFSADDNATWNSLVDLHARLTGQSQSTWVTDFAHGDRIDMISPYNFVAISNVVYATAWQFRSAAGAPAVESLAAVTLRCPLNVTVGDRLKSFTFTLFGNASADVTVTVYKLDLTDGTTTPVSIGTTTLNNPGAAPATTTIDLTDTPVTSTLVFFADFACNASGIVITGASLTRDRPAA